MSQMNPLNNQALEPDQLDRGTDWSYPLVQSGSEKIELNQPLGTQIEMGASLEPSLPANSDNLNLVTETSQQQEDLGIAENSNQVEQDLTEETDWFRVAHQLRQHNRELLAKIAQLEQTTLLVSQQSGQLSQSPDQDILIAQQAEEINNSQEQINRLLRELENSQENAQIQNSQIESFSQQLEATQAQLIQIEQEYGLLEKNYNQQTQQLLESEKHLQELRSRLHRQQRYTLQYKAALDEYLKAPSSAVDLVEPKENESKPSVSVVYSQPIQPWSIQQEQGEVSPQINLTPSEVNSELDCQTLVAEAPKISASEPRELPTETEVKQELSRSEEEKPELPETEIETSASQPEEIADLSATIADKNQTQTQANPIKPRPLSHLISPVPLNKKRKSNKQIELPQFSRQKSS